MNQLKTKVMENSKMVSKLYNSYYYEPLATMFFLKLSDLFWQTALKNN